MTNHHLPLSCVFQDGVVKGYTRSSPCNDVSTTTNTNRTNVNRGVPYLTCVSPFSSPPLAHVPHSSVYDFSLYDNSHSSSNPGQRKKGGCKAFTLSVLVNDVHVYSIPAKCDVRKSFSNSSFTKYYNRAQYAVIPLVSDGSAVCVVEEAKKGRDGKWFVSMQKECHPAYQHCPTGKRHPLLAFAAEAVYRITVLTSTEATVTLTVKGIFDNGTANITRSGSHSFHPTCVISPSGSVHNQHKRDRSEGEGESQKEQVEEKRLKKEKRDAPNVLMVPVSNASVSLCPPVSPASDSSTLVEPASPYLTESDVNSAYSYAHEYYQLEGQPTGFCDLPEVADVVDLSVLENGESAIFAATAFLPSHFSFLVKKDSLYPPVLPPLFPALSTPSTPTNAVTNHKRSRAQVYAEQMDVKHEMDMPLMVDADTDDEDTLSTTSTKKSRISPVPSEDGSSTVTTVASSPCSLTTEDESVYSPDYVSVHDDISSSQSFSHQTQLRLTSPLFSSVSPSLMSVLTQHQRDHTEPSQPHGFVAAETTQINRLISPSPSASPVNSALPEPSPPSESGSASLAAAASPPSAPTSVSLLRMKNKKTHSLYNNNSAHYEDDAKLSGTSSTSSCAAHTITITAHTLSTPSTRQSSSSNNKPEDLMHLEMKDHSWGGGGIFYATASASSSPLSFSTPLSASPPASSVSSPVPRQNAAASSSTTAAWTNNKQSVQPPQSFSLERKRSNGALVESSEFASQSSQSRHRTKSNNMTMEQQQQQHQHVVASGTSWTSNACIGALPGQ